MTPETHMTAYDDFMDFIFEHIDGDKIADFKASPQAQQRFHELLDKNNRGYLSEDEKVELDLTVLFEQLLMVLKARSLAQVK